MISFCYFRFLQKQQNHHDINFSLSLFSLIVLFHTSSLFSNLKSRLLKREREKIERESIKIFFIYLIHK